MIIICDKCNTKFNIKDSIIPEGGADFKCTKCSNLLRLEKAKKVEPKKVKAKKVEPKKVDKVDDLDYGSLFGDDSSSSSEPKKEETFNDLFSSDFSSFEERPTIVAPTEEVDYSSLEEEEEESELEVKAENKIESSFSSSESPNFLSEKAKDGPSFDDVFGEMGNDFLDDDEKTMIAPYSQDVKIEMEKFEEPIEEKSTIEQFKDKLKDGLDQDSFEEIPKAVVEESKNFKHIFVKQEGGPTYEFKEESDLIEWLKTKKDPNSLLYSHDNTNFETISNYPLIKNLKGIIGTVNKDVVKTEEIAFKKPEVSSTLAALDNFQDDKNEKDNKNEKEKKKGGFLKLLLILLFLLLLAAVAAYFLHQQKIINLPFLPKVETKVDQNNVQNEKDQNKKREVKENKDQNKVEENKDQNEKPEVKEKAEENKIDENKVEENKDQNEKPEVKEKVEENKDQNKKPEDNKVVLNGKKVSKNTANKKYRNAREKYDQERYNDARKDFLELALEFPEDPEAFGTLYAIYKNLGDMTTAKKFRRAYKELTKKEKNTHVSTDLLNKLLKAPNTYPEKKEVEKTKPNTRKERYIIARKNLATKNYKEAKINFLELALESPSDAEAYGALSIIYKNLGDDSTSKKFYNASNQLNSGKANTTVSTDLLKKLLSK